MLVVGNNTIQFSLLAICRRPEFELKWMCHKPEEDSTSAHPRRIGHKSEDSTSAHPGRIGTNQEDLGWVNGQTRGGPY